MAKLKPVLACDIDGTIWEPYGIAAEEINRITGLEISLEDMTHYDSFHQLAGVDAANAGFVKACGVPAAVPDREMYPGVVDALKEIHEMGIFLHFVTHNSNPRPMRPALKRWIESRVGFEVGMSITGRNHGKIPILRRVGAFGTIDDKPDFIARVADAGLWAATLIQPWNVQTVQTRYDIHGFTHWDQLPALVADHLETQERV